MVLRLCLVFAGILIFTAANASSCIGLATKDPAAHGPAYNPGDRYKNPASQGVRDYAKEHFDYSAYLNRHTWNGKYFNYDVTRSFSGDPRHVITDEYGLPKVLYYPVRALKYPGGFEYNPTTIAQYGLMNHAKYLAGDQSAKAGMLLAANKLIEMQGRTGGFEYPFPYQHYQNARPYRRGWTSALAQSQALSLFARVYAITGDEKYTQAGDTALTFLLKPMKEGGAQSTLAGLDPSLSNYVMFEEYPTSRRDHKLNYTVNGLMHTLIGLYDWSHVDAAKTHAAAREYFDCGAASLKKIIPYAEIGGFSAYDLDHVIFKRRPLVNPAYHLVHIYMLFAMFDLTKDDFFRDWALKWAKEVDPNLSEYQAYLARVAQSAAAR